MKNIIIILLAGMLAFSMSGCGKQPPQPSATEPTVLTEEASAPPTDQIVPTETTTPPRPVRDYIDLTILSSTMRYAEVFNMVSSPEDYVGATVKMQGILSRGKLYVPDGSLTDGGVVFSCIILDATSCCAQGIPFDLAGDPSFPEDYPPLESEITVIGTFEIHEQDGLTFSRLANASFVE